MIVGWRTTIRKFVAVSLVALFVVTLGAIYVEPFESFLAWVQRYEKWQVDEIIVISVVLIVVFGFYYSWRNRRQLQHEVAERQRELAERKRIEEELRRSEAHYRAIVTGSPVALFAVDPEGVFTLAEGKGLEALGLEPDKVVGQTIFESYHDASQVVENTHRALAGQASSVITEVDGLTFETRYSPLWEGGEFSGMLGVAVDITGRVRAEENLREAEQKYRTLVEQIPAVTYIDLADDLGTSVYTSPQIEQMLGYTPGSGTRTSCGPSASIQTIGSGCWQPTNASRLVVSRSVMNTAFLPRTARWYGSAKKRCWSEAKRGSPCSGRVLCST
jgi:PAS domain S-box-containing protein